MLKIYIVRHGQDQDNARGILNGHRNEPLTELGISQAEQLAQKIQEAGLTFDVVYSSPLKWAFATAQIITDTLHLNPPIPLDGLIERDFGVMTGKLVKDIETLCAPNILKTEVITYFITAENAETFPQLLDRAKRVLQDIESKHSDGSVLLATHGDFGKMLYAAYHKIDWQEVLKLFHFGNSELLLLAPNVKPEDSHIFKIEQFNH